MNGAIAELCARAISVPMTKRVTNIGASHHLLFLQKNENSSPTIPKRPAAVRTAVEIPIATSLSQSLVRLTTAPFQKELLSAVGANQHGPVEGLSAGSPSTLIQDSP